MLTGYIQGLSYRGYTMSRKRFISLMALTIISLIKLLYSMGRYGYHPDKELVTAGPIPIISAIIIIMEVVGSILNISKSTQISMFWM